VFLPRRSTALATLACELAGRRLELPLWSTERDRVRRKGDWIEFSLPADDHTYLTTARSGVRKPDLDGPLVLAPGAEHWVDLEHEAVGGVTGLWLLDFDAAGQATRHKVRLKSGTAALHITTGARHRVLTVAVRLSGTGKLRLGRLVISNVPAMPARELLAARKVETGPEGGFRRWSLFFDPAGYRPYAARHHAYYDGREPSWYAPTANRVADRPRVLEIGSGPGLLLEQLRAGDPERVVCGLERDPVYLERCRQKGIPVVAQDLNLPFPYLASGSFDAVLAHHSLDSLTPAALAACLRECARVLVPGGRFWAKSQRRGQATGEVTRTVALTRELLAPALAEAGFTDVKIGTPDVSIVIDALSSGPSPWPTRALDAFPGLAIRPWRAPDAPLAPAAGHVVWDDRSRRDFVLVTDEEKREVRPGGARAGYFTGYAGPDLERAVCRAESDGDSWRRMPAEPVLRGGLGWDDGGVAAGSVLRVDGGYRMYFSGRDPGGTWRGVGIAESDDGLSWRKRPDPVLRLEDHPGCKHLALADVVRGSDGVWRMHCEAWRGSGWHVVQSVSTDGLAWERAEVVLEPSAVAWAGRHVANPKAVEVAPGQWLLGFNGAGADLRFQLGLARSTDGRRWQALEPGPLICSSSDHRLESLFTTREAWTGGSQEVFYFAAATATTTSSSDVRRASADDGADWVGPPWASPSPGLYRVRDGQLIALPGAREAADRLAREVALEGRDCQVLVRAAAGAGGEIAVRAGGAAALLASNGQARVGDRQVAPVADDGAEVVAAAVRVHRAAFADAELELVVWHDERIVGRGQVPIEGPVEQVAIDLGVAPDGAAMAVDFIDVFTLGPREVEAPGDALWEVPAGGDPAEALAARDPAPGRVLACARDADLAAVDPARAPGRLFPIVRVPTIAAGYDEDGRYRADQLELLWQAGRLIGIDLRGVASLPAAIRDWLSARLVVQLVDAAEPVWADLPGIVVGGGRLDEAGWSAWLARGRQRYALLSSGSMTPPRAAMVSRQPDRWLVASAGNPAGWADAVGEVRARFPAGILPLVLSENLRFVIDSVQRARWAALLDPATLRFPSLPVSADECAQQGFEVVAPDQLPAGEHDEAKQFWAGYGVKSWYRDRKPWAGVLAQLVRDLGARSVLEFGCNVGRNLAAIAEHCPGVELTGIDINQAAISAGREKTGLDLRVADERGLAAFADGAFDLVFCVSVLDHIADVAEVCRELVRVARRHLFLMEVRLPVEGRVARNFEHSTRTVRESTGASYSWHLEKHLAGPRVRRLQVVPCYLHAGSLGPYYATYLADLAPC
jgi:SAM-dependent methyltransferase